MKKTLILCIVGISLLLTGCATYHLSKESLLQQFGDTRPERKYIYAPFVFPFSVAGNDLKTLKCLDKNGNEKIITVTNHTSVRITLTDSTRRTFYFNTLLIKDSTITGSKTHFFEAHIKPVKLQDISGIEIQKD